MTINETKCSQRRTKKLTNLNSDQEKKMEKTLIVGIKEVAFLNNLWMLKMLYTLLY